MRRRAAVAFAAAIGLAHAGFAVGQSMTKAEYEVARKNVVSDFRTARIGCEPMPAGVRDTCMADVTGREGLRLAELEALYQRAVREKCEALEARPREQCLAAPKRLPGKS